MHGFDPFVNFGLANGRMDQHFLPRPFEIDLPFRTLGYMADFEGGLEYKVLRRLTVGFSVWDVLPFGPQKIYSNIVWEQPGIPIQTVGGPVGTGGLSPLAADKQIIYPVGPTTGTLGTFGYIEGDPITAATGTRPLRPWVPTTSTGTMVIRQRWASAHSGRWTS